MHCTGFYLNTACVICILSMHWMYCPRGRHETRDTRLDTRYDFEKFQIDFKLWIISIHFEHKFLILMFLEVKYNCLILILVETKNRNNEILCSKSIQSMVCMNQEWLFRYIRHLDSSNILTEIRRDSKWFISIRVCIGFAICADLKRSTAFDGLMSCSHPP